MYKKIFITLFLWLGCINAYAIVSIESLKIDGSDLGLTSNVGIDIDGSKGNSDKSDVLLDVDTVWRAVDYIHYILVSYEYGESNRQVDANKSFFHARHIRKGSDQFDHEYFVQSEKDEFERLTSRNIIGAGLRFEIPINGFFGLGAFYFDERLDDSALYMEPRKDDGVRFNSYISGEYAYDDRTSFTARLYAQPRVDSLDDIRVLFNAAFKFAISSKASFRFGLKSSYDSEPPADIDKSDFSYSSGFQYSF